MSYKPDERDWMAYLYGELEGEEKDRFEQYLQTNIEAQNELLKYQQLRNLISHVDDKEVIAPPLVLGDNKQQFWDTPYVKTILSIAASLIIVILVGRMAGISMRVTDNEFKLTFGQPVEVKNESPVSNDNSLTKEQVRDMINASLQNNNLAIEETWKKNEEKLTASIKKNLETNSNRIDQLVKDASSVSQRDIRDFVASMQSENMRMVKDYFQLTSTDQKKYIEGLLVDFSQYLQQQRNNDLQLVDTRLRSLEQNTNIFQQETEQILTSIISSVGTTKRENKN
ncbi:anti-sigma factor family protein [Chryseosolibacter indicus]|uniref:Anti-sigma factor n=1 Tax=Chryseosolibacter indicus TaxID=2782351 RepID=A0ABS5VXM9_9BACT|nr:hypothetical protein [Chryseosolibacter indicus]MBT1705659.1 hypothetical protein [Chryseosolibacter indicus]